MNTNALKIFAKEARDILIPAVSQRLLYWGFDTKGQSSEELMLIEGGYIFRGMPFNDPTVPEKFQRLQGKIQNDQSFKDIREEAAYTWFNRLMAIKILEKNGYEKPILAYSEGTNTPQILQDARRKVYTIADESTQALLQTYLLNNEEEAAFALLLTDYCNQQPLLKTVFGSINDYTELLVPGNALSSKGIVQYINNTTAITDEAYQEVELIGWLYQFYISDRKDEVFAGFKKRKKARAEDIPAATQIFTPKWIVQYMVENTVGKLYLEIEPDADDFRESLEYFVKTEAVLETASVSSVTASISSIEDIRILDPACGSGHILVVAFDVLMKAYDEEGYSPRQAAEKILYQHLYGLDIDDRAAQLANFAVRLKAAQYNPNLLQPKADSTDEVNIYAFPEAATFSAADIAFVLGETWQDKTFALENALTILAQGKNLGSAIKLTEFDAEDAVFFKNRLAELTKGSQQNHLSFSEQQQFYKLRPYLRILTILMDRFPAVVANPPYMGSGSMNADLKNYLDKNYPISKSDLMTVFMESIPNQTLEGGYFGIINMPSWLFLSSFEKLRNFYIKNYRINSLLHMGRGIFGIDFGSTAFIVQKTPPNNRIGNYFRLHERNFQHIHFDDIKKLFLNSNGNKNYKYDFSLYRGEGGTTEITTESITTGQQIFYPNIAQNNFAKIPGSPIAYWVSEKIKEVFQKEEKIGTHCKVIAGICTGANAEFIFDWYEISFQNIHFNSEKINKSGFVPHNKGGEARKWYGNHTSVLNYNLEALQRMEEKKGFRHDGNEYYFKPCISWAKITSKVNTFRYYPKGFCFDSAGLGCFFNYDIINLELLALLNTKLASNLLKIINPTLNASPSVIRKLPFPNNKIKDNIQNLTQINIEISKTDWDSRETSWDFEQSPLIAAQGTDLAAAYDKWERQVTVAFYQLHANEEELNRIFIDIYGLQAELTPEVPLKDITILQSEVKGKEVEKIEVGAALPINRGEVIQQLISYAIGCYMGRYRLDKTGLHIAHPNASASEIAVYDLKDRGGFRNRLGLDVDLEEGDLKDQGGFQNRLGLEEVGLSPLTFEIDEDGIMPMMGSACSFADDAVTLVKAFIEKVWGEDSLTQNLNFINDALGETLESYLINPLKYWKHHTSTYKKRPIYWLFASSQKGKPAFQVLAYLHRMDKYTVQKIRTNYLHPHQAYLSEQLEQLESNGTDQKTIDSLALQVTECRAYDETLKALENKQIDMDLDDGVLVNYELFGVAVRKV